MAMAKFHHFLNRMLSFEYKNDLLKSVERVDVRKKRILTYGIIASVPLILVFLLLGRMFSRQAYFLRTANILKQIRLSLDNYHDTCGRYPPSTLIYDNKEECSWRYAIIPFTEYGGASPSRSQRIGDDLKKPWKEGFMQDERVYFYGSSRILMASAK
jgi:hypothetical protein